MGSIWRKAKLELGLSRCVLNFRSWHWVFDKSLISETLEKEVETLETGCDRSAPEVESSVSGGDGQKSLVGTGK
jgi:hypothetical protein